VFSAGDQGEDEDDEHEQATHDNDKMDVDEQR
jgi:hypothetical protein